MGLIVFRARLVSCAMAKTLFTVILENGGDLVNVLLALLIFIAMEVRALLIAPTMM